MKKLLTGLILSFLFVVPAGAQEKADSNDAKLVSQVQTGSTETAKPTRKEQSVGMDPFKKDVIDAITKIVGLIGVFVAIIMAFYQIRKNRQERKDQLEETRLNTKINQATFWLELRKMFSEHNEVHLKLRGGGGEWSKGNIGPSSREEWAKVEAYMGLFEHCKRMLDDGLIDWDTFKNIYDYRIDNILANQIIVKEKLVKHKEGWPVFLKLVERLGKTVPTYNA